MLAGAAAAAAAVASEAAAAADCDLLRLHPISAEGCTQQYKLDVGRSPPGYTPRRSIKARWSNDPITLDAIFSSFLPFSSAELT